MSPADPAATVAAPSRSDWQRVLGLLDVALELDPAARARWLEGLAREEARLAPLLEQLLGVHAQRPADDFMRVPAIEALGVDAPAAPPLASTDRVGPYRLLREIGQGGMATVWLAERADGLLDRQVALKLPHVSWGAASFAERMARERNILASLAHPNIARLYDAGLAADGRPFLALEYIDGQPIDSYCAGRGSGVRERVELVLQVARAIAHAHAQLVVHRDLKPSNILVDAQGRTHLLDFGIAKLVDPDFEDAGVPSNATLATGRALTPDYASPEQIRGAPIGTSSDVYSLGVVAFELLAGVRPYRLNAGVGAVAMAEAMARIEVPRASRVASTRALQRELAGDLDAILARTLAKPAAERYATVDALADDLERYLRGEPVRARAASRGYVAGRWLLRHKIEAAIALALLLAVAGGAYAQVLVALALGVGAVAALWQRNRAVRQAEIAEAAQARGEQVKNFVASIFTQAVPRAGRGGAVAAADLLRAAARRVETDLAGQPAVAAELGLLIGVSFNELGEMRAGLDWLPKAVELATRELGATHGLTLEGRWRWIEAANHLGELAISEPLLPALLRDLRAAEPPQPQLLSQALEEAGFVHAKRAREADSIAALSEAVDVATRQLGEASDSALLARVALSNTLIHFARKPEALAAIAPALVLARAAHGAHRPHRVLLAVERGQADAMASNQRPRDAVDLLRQVLEDQRSLDNEDTPRVREAMTFLGKALLLSGRLDEAARMFEQAAALHEQLTGGSNHEGAGAQTWRGRVCVMRGDGAAALEHLAHADEIAATLGDEGAAQTSHRASLRVWAQSLAGDNAAALAATDALSNEAPTPTGQIAMRLLLARAMALRQAGRSAEARDCADRAIAAATAGDCPAIEHGLALVEAARCHAQAGEPAEAARCRSEALAVWEAGQVDGSALPRPGQAPATATSEPT